MRSELISENWILWTIGGFPWTVSRSIWRFLLTQDNTNRRNTDIYLCPQLDSNSWSQLSSGRRHHAPENALQRHRQKVNSLLCRAISQTVSLWLTTAAAQVQARVWSCAICGRQSSAGAIFLRVLRFTCQFSFHQLLHNHHHLSCGTDKIGQ
jgi:hypothetical protein